MRNRVETALRETINNQWFIDNLQGCQTPTERKEMVIKALLPEIKDWPIIVRRQLIFECHHLLKIDFGVCTFYIIIDDHYQFCQLPGQERECNCDVPQELCVFRDPKVKKLASLK